VTFEANEQIEVLAEFKNGNLKPRKFRWRNRVYKIKRICGAYRHREGQSMTYNYAVMSDSGNVYEITFNLNKASWYLRRVHG
jgi:hypothetical protein